MKDKIKIYDCFTFFNELDLLEIRLRALDQIVDYFVIVEANKTFSGAKKNSIFLKNKKRFHKWNDKIIYQFVNLPEFNFVDRIIIYLIESKYLPKFGTNSLGLNYLARLFGIGRWKLVFWQRDQLVNSLKDAKNRDIVLFSDLDEIPLIKSKSYLENLIKEDNEVVFKHKSFIYYLNGFVESGWLGTRAFRFKDFLKDFSGKFSFIRDTRIQQLFKSKDKKMRTIYPGGWHFTYTGTIDNISLKTKSTAERNTEISREKLIVNQKIGVIEDRQGRKTTATYINPKKLFPENILKILKDYPHLIKN